MQFRAFLIALVADYRLELMHGVHFSVHYGVRQIRSIFDMLQKTKCPSDVDETGGLLGLVPTRASQCASTSQVTRSDPS